MQEISNIRRKHCKCWINVRTVGKKRTERRKISGVITTQAFFAIDFHSCYGSEQFSFFALEFVCCHNRRKVNHSPPTFTVISHAHLPCEQRLLSCMAFSVYEVVRVACLSLSWSVYAPWETLNVERFSRGVNKPITWQTSHAHDFVNAKKKHATEKPLLATGTAHYLAED